MAAELMLLNPALPPPKNPFEAIFFWVLLSPVAIVLHLLNQAFSHFGVTATIGAFGLAIIALTLIIRGLLFPLFRWQIATQWKIQDQQRIISPELKELQQKYKKDKAKLQEETMALYRRHGINPLSQLSGCLPLLIQMPFIYALYGSIDKLSGELKGKAGFLWIANLQQKPLEHGVGSLLTHPLLLIVPILAGVLTFAQTKMMMQPPRPDMTDQERQMQRVMAQTTYLMPIMIAFFALNFAQGIGIYWITQSGIMVLQVFTMMGWGGLKVPSWFPGSGWIPPKSPRARLAMMTAGGSSAVGQARIAPASPPSSNGKSEPRARGRQGQTNRRPRRRPKSG